MHLNISDIVVVTRRLLNIASYCDVKDAIATHTLLVAEWLPEKDGGGFGAPLWWPIHKRRATATNITPRVAENHVNEW